MAVVRITEHLREGQLEAELAKVDERRDPPVPVVARVLDDWWDGELHGWARNPRGVDGMWGLVFLLREYAHGFWAEHLSWVRSEDVRPR